MSPLEYAKRNAFKTTGRRQRSKDLPYIHIQDIEDYYDAFQQKKFFNMIDDLGNKRVPLGKSTGSDCHPRESITWQGVAKSAAVANQDRLNHERGANCSKAGQEI